MLSGTARRLGCTVSSRAVSDPLAPFSEPTRAWFAEAFAEPTRAQRLGWAAISGGHHTLLHAPTGSGKTLAAFLWCLDRCFSDPRPIPARPARGSVRILYVSPLKALAYSGQIGRAHV